VQKGLVFAQCGSEGAGLIVRNGNAMAGVENNDGAGGNLTLELLSPQELLE
jgi:hypothetical protein